MSKPAHLKASRQSVRFVACPDCDAPARMACVGVRGERAANHRGRVSAFIAWRDKVLKGKKQ